MSTKPRILFFDIETSPTIGYTWGLWQQNVISTAKEWEILSFAWKWANEKTTHCRSRIDFKDQSTDVFLLAELWDLLDSADIVIAHNGNDFDIKKSNARFLVQGLPPPSPYISIDTKLVARRYFKFNSNSLDALGKLLKCGQKLKHTGFDLWLGCMSGNKKSWKLMIKYNKQDVKLLEQVYLKLRPWINNHPNHSNQVPGKPAGCPKCGSLLLKSCGYRHTKTSSYLQWRCLDCKGYCRSQKAEKIIKPKVVNL